MAPSAAIMMAAGPLEVRVDRLIQEAYVQGVSTRSVDELVKAMG
jgi:transposase-like protein